MRPKNILAPKSNKISSYLTFYIHTQENKTFSLPYHLKIINFGSKCAIKYGSNEQRQFMIFACIETAMNWLFLNVIAEFQKEWHVCLSLWQCVRWYIFIDMIVSLPWKIETVACDRSLWSSHNNAYLDGYFFPFE